MAVQDSAHNVEIELKARIQNKEEIESRLAKFMRLTGNIDKRDEYWEVSGKDPLSSGTFRFRVRREAGHTTITFKDKTFDGIWKSTANLSSASITRLHSGRSWRGSRGDLSTENEKPEPAGRARQGSWQKS